MRKVKRYKIVEANTLPLLESKLNEAGKEGYRLVEILDRTSGYIVAILIQEED